MIAAACFLAAALVFAFGVRQMLRAHAATCAALANDRRFRLRAPIDWKRAEVQP